MNKVEMFSVDFIMVRHFLQIKDHGDLIPCWFTMLEQVLQYVIAVHCGRFNASALACIVVLDVFA